MAQDRTKSLTNKALSRMIKERRAYLTRVLNAVVKLASQEGKVLLRSTHSAHTHVVWELRDFEGFTFHADLGQTMFGGNTVKVYYHPGRSFGEGGIDSAHDQEWAPVLEVDFQTGDEHDYRVKKFKESAEWRRVLDRVLRNSDKIAAQAKKTEKKVDKRAERQRAAEARRLRLAKEAGELGITTL